MRHLSAFVSLALGFTAVLAAQPADGRPSSPPVAQAMPRPIGPSKEGVSQRAYVPYGGDTLIARVTAEGIIEGFRKTQKTDGAPRIVILVNRTLADDAPGRAGGSAKTDAAPAAGAPPASGPSLADRQTTREIERLFGRMFRHGGAQLADLAALPPPEQADAATPAGERAGRSRQALAAIADVAIEVLVSSRRVTVPEVAGDAVYTLPDIQATAIRLKDAAIIGQASAADVLGRGARAGRLLRDFSVQDITEATALALMEDMLAPKK